MRKVLSFIADYFDEREFLIPYYRLQEAGFEVDIAGPEAKVYQGKEGLHQQADLSFDHAKAEDYEGLLIPGGYAPDKMRTEEEALALVRAFVEAGKPVGMICHAGWVGVSAGVVAGKKVTSTPAIKEDLMNAGAEWLDEAPVVDGGLVTARNPKDLPVYVKAFLTELEK